MEVSWANLARNEEILHTVKEERTMVRTVKRRKGNWMATSCVEIAI
jgi:hypothetical protein